MVINCVAYGCNTLHDWRNKVSFHRFPFKRPDILELWVAAVRRDNWYPSKTSRLCAHHFLQTDYQVRPGCTLKLLKPEAVPSVFSFSKYFKDEVVQSETLITNSIKDECQSNEPSTSTETRGGRIIKLLKPEAASFQKYFEEEAVECETFPKYFKEEVVYHEPLITNTPDVPIKVEVTDVDVENSECQSSEPSTSTPVKVLINAETQTRQNYRSILFHLRREVKTLKQKVKRRDKQIAAMKDLINKISDNADSNENNLT